METTDYLRFLYTLLILLEVVTMCFGGLAYRCGSSRNPTWLIAISWCLPGMGILVIRVGR